MYDTDLNKSKIININDFIFRQNLEFYPNLNGLVCEDNTLKYIVNNQVVASEVLTFDLRTLPGGAWNVSPLEFINIIRLNKETKGLSKFLELMQEYAYGSIF